jgi:outer membrane protein assembly factor BamB
VNLIKGHALISFAAVMALVVPALMAAPSDRESTADQWPQFRGPRGGVAPDDARLPESWSATENVVWRADIPGVAWSSPIVWDDQIFVTSAINTIGDAIPKPGLYGSTQVTTATTPVRWMVYAIDFATGKIRWERELARMVPRGPKHEKNSFATETPATDGERLYVYFGSIGLFALNMKGEVLWTREMPPIKIRSGWGTAASPIVHNGRVYIVNDNDTQSFLAAFDARTGSEVWRVPRDEGTNWSTPFVWENEKRTEIVTAGADKVRSYGLDGKLLWEMRGLTWITIPTPIASDGLLYVSAGYLNDPIRPTYAIRPGASGDITLKEGETSNEYIAWFNPRLAAYSPSPMAYRGYYYVLLDRGLMLCHDAKTGKQIYGLKRIATDSSGFTASPWAYNGKIFALSEDGDTFVIEAGPEFKILAKNSLGEMALATPAIAKGSLIIRTQSKLYRIANGAAN